MLTRPVCLIYLSVAHAHAARAAHDHVLILTDAVDQRQSVELNSAGLPRDLSYKNFQIMYWVKPVFYLTQAYYENTIFSVGVY